MGDLEDTIAELGLLENLKPLKNTSDIAFLFALGFKYRARAWRSPLPATLTCRQTPSSEP